MSSTSILLAPQSTRFRQMDSWLWLGISVALFAALACADARREPVGPQPEPQLEVVHRFPTYQLTGVAVSREGRLFVNFPRWSDLHDLSVAEVLADGTVRAFPDADWNSWDENSQEDPGRRFVCAQSVYVDADDTLWVLDPASARFMGVVSGGAKLVAVDLTENAVARAYIFDNEVAPVDSYLNDVRVDPGSGFAYMTDSSRGALVVLNLDTGEARRLLDGHPALRAEDEVVPVVGGREWRDTQGNPPRVHSDGIALDIENQRLYWHALTGRRLYAIATRHLTDPDLEESEIAEHIEDLGDTVVTDGMILDAAGNLYHSALELDGVVVYRPDGTLETLIQDPQIAWPDSFALGPDGDLYLTTSQIHLAPAFGGTRTEPYKVLRLKLP